MLTSTIDNPNWEEDAIRIAAPLNLNDVATQGKDLNDAIATPGTDADFFSSDSDIVSETVDEDEPLMRNHMARKRQHRVILSDSEEDERFCEEAGSLVEKARRIGT